MSKRGYWIMGGVAAAVLALFVGTSVDFPASGDKAAGTIVPAERVRNAQPSAAEVKLVEPSRTPSPGVPLATGNTNLGAGGNTNVGTGGANSNLGTGGANSNLGAGGANSNLGAGGANSNLGAVGKPSWPPELGEHIADRPGGHRIALDEDDFTGTPRERLEPECPTAREQVQVTCASQLELQPVEHGIPDSVRSWSQACRWWEMQLATAPFATDDSYFEAAACNSGRAACRGTALRTVCCFGKTACPRGFRAIVARHLQASVGFVTTTKTRDGTRGLN